MNTGAVAATDPPLAYAAGDVAAGRAPQLVGAAYTYNKIHDKLTTNYAIDRATGSLVMQGTAEGVTPAVSPNTGQLRTVGALGTGPVDDAAFMGEFLGVVGVQHPGNLHHPIENLAVVDLHHIVAAGDADGLQSVRQHGADLGVGSHRA